jgi:iron complex transport system substrate-binding protein
VPGKLAGRNRVPAGEALEFYPPAYRNPVAIRQLPDRDDPAGDADLLALKPDVYVDYGSLHEDYVSAVEAVQRRTGVPGIILDGRLERIPSTYRRLGTALGESARGERLAAAAERLIATYRGALASGRAPLRVYLACSSDGVIPCLSDETAGEQLALLGAVNVAGSSATAPRRPRTVDEIAAMSPDVIVVSTAGAAGRLRRNPEWQGVEAVARGRVHQFPDLPDGWGSRPPSVNRLAGLIWLAYVLPERPFDQAFYDDIRLFFSTFYHVDLTREQMQRLVAPRPQEQPRASRGR